MMASHHYLANSISQQTFVPPTEPQPEPEEFDSKQKKRRTRNPQNWKKEKRKRAILSGQEYVNTKGELVGPRAMGPDCKCKHKCFNAVPMEARATIFNGFYSLKSYDEQNAYLYGLIRRYDIQKKKKPLSERRTCSYKYFVRIKGKETQVCKRAFANIHGISDKKIRTLCIKHEQNILFPRDNRGRHNNRPRKVTNENVTEIKQHILKMLSGSNGTDFVKTDKIQGPEVNISNLYKNFVQQFEPNAIDVETGKVLKNYDCKVKSWLYFKVFHEEFNSVDLNAVKRKLPDLRKSLEVSGVIQAKKKSKPAKPSQKPVPPKEPAPTYPEFSHYPTVNPQTGISHDFGVPNTDNLQGHVPSYYLCLGHMPNLLSLSQGQMNSQPHFGQQFPQQVMHVPTTIEQNHIHQPYNNVQPHLY